MVVGGGPAGATVALCAARAGWRVGLIERTHYEEERHGETLPPQISPLLRNLGVWESFQALGPLPSPGIRSAWGGATPMDQDFIRGPYGPGWHVNRRRFDRMIAEESALAGASLFLGTKVRGCSLDASSGWKIGCRTAEAPLELRTRLIVDASGQNGTLRNVRDQPWRVHDSLLAIVLRFSRASPAQPEDLRAYIESTPTGWWYSAPVPRGELVCMFFTDPEIYVQRGVQLGEELNLAPLTNARLTARDLIDSKTVSARSAALERSDGPGWLAVGDSSAAHDPISGIGVFEAVKQGQACAAAADSWLRGDLRAARDYSETVIQRFRSYAAERDNVYNAEERWRNQHFWQRRSVPVRF